MKHTQITEYHDVKGAKPTPLRPSFLHENMWIIRVIILSVLLVAFAYFTGMLIAGRLLQPAPKKAEELPAHSAQAAFVSK
ncbi:MAG: hypothetical protein PHG02_03150 [Oscillospiraceae bacterium]|nr:hypothetical protein [Oscillospiraceae bacterium]